MGNIEYVFSGINTILLLIILIIVINPHTISPSISLDSISHFIEHHQGLIALLGIIITLIIFKLSLRKQEEDKTKEIRKRLETACKLISQEVEEFKRRLLDNSRIVWDLQPEFFNIHFYFDGYESVLHSDLFSHFNEETQYKIKALYERVKLHNEILMYRVTFRNQYFLHDDSLERLNKWYKAAYSINSYLYGLEDEIYYILEDVENSLKIEKEKITV